MCLGINLWLILHGVLADERHILRLTYLLIILLTPWSTFHPGKLNSFQLVKKNSAFNGTRSFITAFTCSLQLDPVPAPKPIFLNMELNTTIASTPGCSKMSLSLNFPYQNFVHISLLPNTCSMSLYSHCSGLDQPKNIE